MRVEGGAFFAERSGRAERSVERSGRAERKHGQTKLSGGFVAEHEKTVVTAFCHCRSERLGKVFGYDDFLWFHRFYIILRAKVRFLSEK